MRHINTAKVTMSQVQTMSLAYNGISNGTILSTMGHYMPRLANLSLEGNALKVWRDLDCISGKRGKLEHLRELILKGNPIREIEYQNNRAEKYRRYVTAMLLQHGSEHATARLHGGSPLWRCLTKRRLSRLRLTSLKHPLRGT
jgi:hypothetical protein